MIALLLTLTLATAADEPPKPKIAIGKDTTIVDGPLDRDGYVDFAAALNAKLRGTITPQTNSNVAIWQILGPKPEGGGGMPPDYFKELGIAAPPEEGDYFKGYHKFSDTKTKEEPERKRLSEMEEAAMGRPWTAKEFPEVAEWLTASDGHLAKVVEATKRPDYFNPLMPATADGKRGMLISSLLPQVQKCRELAAALMARAYLRISKGQFDAAWEDLQAVRRLGRHVSRGSTLIEWLVGVALEQIAAKGNLVWLEKYPGTGEQILAKRAELDKLPPLAAIAGKIDLGERFLMLDAAQGMSRGNVGIGVELGVDKATAKTLDAGVMMKTANPWYDRIVAAMKKADRTERNRELTAIETDLKALSDKFKDESILAKFFAGLDPKTVTERVSNTLLSLLLPSTRKVQDAADRTVQNQRNLGLAFALAAYQRDHKKYPAKLDDLAPKYVKDVTGDLFSGKPLNYKPTDDGYVLYSVGLNGKDDEGNEFGDGKQADDLVVRMPVKK